MKNGVLKTSIKDILFSLEGKECFEIADEADSHVGRILKNKVWERTKESICRTTEAMTLEDVALEFKKMMKTFKHKQPHH